MLYHNRVISGLFTCRAGLDHALTKPVLHTKSNNCDGSGKETKKYGLLSSLFCPILLSQLACCEENSFQNCNFSYNQAPTRISNHYFTSACTLEIVTRETDSRSRSGLLLCFLVSSQLDLISFFFQKRNVSICLKTQHFSHLRTQCPLIIPLCYDKLPRDRALRFPSGVITKKAHITIDYQPTQ